MHIQYIGERREEKKKEKREKREERREKREACKKDTNVVHKVMEKK